MLRSVPFLRAVLVISGFLSLCRPEPVPSRTWFIKADGSGDAPTIQAGIDASAAGDTVLVGPGVYEDTVHVQVQGQDNVVNAFIAKDIRLISSDGPASTVIDGTVSDFAIVAEGVGASGEISGFQILGVRITFGCIVPLSDPRDTVPVLQQAGIRCIASTCIISSNEIHSIENGIYATGSDITISDCHFRDCVYGVRSDGPSAPVVRLCRFQDCAVAVSTMDSSPLITDNRVGRTIGKQACRGFECVGGIAPAGSVLPVLRANRVEGIASEAIWCSGVTPTIEDNVVLGVIGISVNYCPQGTVRRNVVANASQGVVIQGSILSVESNTLDNNNTGVAIVSFSNAVVHKNIIRGGLVGIECVFPGSLDIACNDVIGMPTKYASNCGDRTGIDGNFSADPQFCGVQGSGNYLLQSDSPCLLGNHPDAGDCGTIGAFGMGCGTVEVNNATWGRVKGLYRKE